MVFIIKGMDVDTDEMGFNQDINLPDRVAIVARVVMGLIMFISSDSAINGDEFEFDHMVTNMNRSE